MDLKEAVAVAKQQVAGLLAPAIPHNIRLEHFLYDDHLAVWSLTIGYALPDSPRRAAKLVRVSQADKSVLSVADA
jgi:hypothetical protein